MYEINRESRICRKELCHRGRPKIGLINEEKYRVKGFKDEYDTNIRVECKKGVV